MEEILLGLQPIIKKEQTPIIVDYDNLLEVTKTVCSKEISIVDEESMKYAKEYARQCNKVKDYLFNTRKAYKEALLGNYEENSLTLEKMLEKKGKELNKLAKDWVAAQKELDSSVVKAPEKPEQVLYTITLSSWQKDKLQAVLEIVKPYINEEVALTHNLDGGNK